MPDATSASARFRLEARTLMSNSFGFGSGFGRSRISTPFSPRTAAFMSAAFMAASPNQKLVFVVLVLSYRPLSISTGCMVLMTQMICRVLIGAAVVLPALVSPAAAQVQAEVAWCGNLGHRFTIDTQIRGCTALIDSGTMTDKPKAWAHANRGMAFMYKEDLDGALVELTRAIEIDPT